MHVKKFNKSKDFFGHGSIFKISKLKFTDENNINYTFSQFYPHTDLNGIKMAVLCTQDCDIEQKKVTHLNIALLEPIHRPKKENPIKFLSLDFTSLALQFENLNFYSLSSLGALKKKIEELLDNTNSHNYFVEISGTYYFINLSKLYPIKFSHLENLKTNAVYQLKGNFKSLLGWKLANLYGRVGVQVYSSTKKDEITKAVLGKIGKSIKSQWPKNSFQLTDEQLNQIKSKIGTYNNKKSSGKNVDELQKDIYSSLEQFGVVKKIN